MKKQGKKRLKVLQQYKHTLGLQTTCLDKKIHVLNSSCCTQNMFSRIDVVSTVIKGIIEFLPEGEKLTIAVDEIGMPF